jgi:hypothetical protein
MKMRIQCFTTVLAALVAMMAEVPAQTNTLPSLERGQGLGLTSEQRIQRRELMQTTFTNLRAKEAAGTLTAEEQIWLSQAEQRGGFCITGTPPRGAGRGFAAQTNGTGPFNPACPIAAALNAKKAAGTLTPADQALLQKWQENGAFRGRHGRRGWQTGAGMGMRMGMGRGCGWGPTNGCPWLGY